jgi:alkylated DNA repair dioxygenase AlkB
VERILKVDGLQGLSKYSCKYVLVTNSSRPLVREFFTRAFRRTCSVQIVTGRPAALHMEKYFKRIGNTSTKVESNKEQPTERTNMEHGAFIINGQLPFSLHMDLDELLTLKPEQVNTVIILGREIPTPRFVAHYIRPYSYTGKSHAAEPLPELLQPLLDWANRYCSEQPEWRGLYEAGKEFNQALVNFYMDGLHYIGKHSDDERQLEENSPIFSISFGQTRTFRIRTKSDSAIIRDISMKNNSFIVMGGTMQKHYTHEVPKVMGQKGAALGPRVNVTFRMFRSSTSAVVNAFS